LPSSAALSMTTCSGLLQSTLAGLLLAAHTPKMTEDSLLYPAAGGSQAFFPPPRANKGLWGFFSSSAALSTAPCQVSIGPFFLGACCSCSTKVALILMVPSMKVGRSFLDSQGGPQRLLLVLCSTEHSPLSGLLEALLARFLPAALTPARFYLCPGSLGLPFPLQVCSREQVLLFPWLCFSRCSCLCKTACAWKGCRLAAPSGATTSRLSLHRIQEWSRHKSAFQASLAKKHSGRARFGRQKICVSYF